MDLKPQGDRSALDVTVVIVNWNSGEMLRACLASLRNIAFAGEVSTIVVDNASGDGSREMVANDFPHVLLIDSGNNLGFARANNLARSYVSHPLVLFLNPDTRLLDDALDNMANFLREHHDVGAVGCRMVTTDGMVQELGLQWFPSPWTEFVKASGLVSIMRAVSKDLLPVPDPGQSQDLSKLYGGCLMVRSSVLNDVGWFDSRYFMYAEDVDLCRSITDKGWRLHYLCDAEIVHDAGGPTGQAPSGYAVLMQCESVGKLISKYYGGFGYVLYRVGIFVGGLLRATAAAVVSLCRLDGVGKEEHRAALNKASLLIVWSMGLRRATVPRYRGDES